MKYTIFDEKGLPIAFYDKEIHKNMIPQEAIEISDEIWLEFINNQGKRAYFNGQIIDITNKFWDGANWKNKPEQEILIEKKNDLQNLRKQKITYLLAQTDYIIIKISDLEMQLKLGIITPSVYDTEIQKYQPILQKRHNIRDWNESIDTRIQNATSLEELKQIKEEIISYTGQFEE
jgi:hypothetical protein